MIATSGNARLLAKCLFARAPFVPTIVITVYKRDRGLVWIEEPRGIGGLSVLFGGAASVKQGLDDPGDPLSFFPPIVERKINPNRLGLDGTGHHAVWCIWQLRRHGCHFTSG